MVGVRGTHECSVCTKQFPHKWNLVRHLKNKHNFYSCSMCLKNFKTDSAMRLHRVHKHKKCMVCKRFVLNNFQRHVIRCDKKRYSEFKLEDSEHFENILISKLRMCPLPIKWILSRTVKFVKYSTDESGKLVTVAKSKPTFRCLITLTCHKSEFPEQIIKNFNKIVESIDSFQKEGSGWQYVCTDHWLLKVYRYRPLAPSSYIPTPSKLILKNAIINIRNRSDNKCFLWSILAALHPAKTHGYLLSKYLDYEHELNMTGISFPVDIKHISRFEEQNDISVNVFGYSYNKNKIYPIRITTTNQFKHVNLLVLSRGKVKHYCLIAHFDRLLSNIIKN